MKIFRDILVDNDIGYGLVIVIALVLGFMLGLGLFGYLYNLLIQAT